MRSKSIRAIGILCLFILVIVQTFTHRTSASTSPERIVERVYPLYSFPPRSFDEINQLARLATVNILCISSHKNVGSISGSGVIIDARGILLTNAHIAQYFLLETDSPESPVKCNIRTGSPAKDTYYAKLIYIPPNWIKEHAKDITNDHVSGTGENDWALLQITKRSDGTSLPAIFPFVLPEMRELATFTGDSVLLAGYPAGFLASSAIVSDLYAASTIVPVGNLYTFGTGKVEALSLGGNIIAQAGSSGGAVVNHWGRLVGIITTSSDATSTASRELRAITMFHVTESAYSDNQKGLYGLLSYPSYELLRKFTDIYEQFLRSSILEHI